jgi:prepilin-type N-terminal cleavage/methylation domain-containing protein
VPAPVPVLRNADRRGYTLAELLTVLTIAGLLCAIGTPSLLGLTTRWKMESALNYFHATYGYARMLAIRGGVPVELAFDPPARGECVERVMVTVLSADPLVARDLRMAEEFPGVCLRQNNPRSVRFDARGLPRSTDARSVWIRWGGMVDSLTISAVGNISRRP